MRARVPPTHLLVLEVPLDLADREATGAGYDHVQECLRTLIAVSRLASAGVLAGDPMATLKPVE